MSRRPRAPMVCLPWPSGIVCLIDNTVHTVTERFGVGQPDWFCRFHDRLLVKHMGRDE